MVDDTCVNCFSLADSFNIICLFLFLLGGKSYLQIKGGGVLVLVPFVLELFKALLENFDCDVINSRGELLRFFRFWNLTFYFEKLSGALHRCDY